MSNCMIGGKRCSDCCKVLTLNHNKSFREWAKYIRRNGYPDDFKGDKAYHLLKQISKRRAKKLNPHLVAKVRSKQSYFKCVNFNGSGCNNYENRPRMCRDYPYYGRGIEDWESSTGFKSGGLYRSECTYFIKELKLTQYFAHQSYTIRFVTCYKYRYMNVRTCSQCKLT